MGLPSSSSTAKRSACRKSLNAQSCNKPQTATAQQRSNGSCKLLLAPQFPASFAKAQNSPTSPEQDAICYCSLLFPCVLLTAAIAARSAPRVSFPAHLRPSFLSYSVHLLASSLPLSLVLTHSSLSSSLPLSSSLQPSLFLCLVSPPPLASRRPRHHRRSLFCGLPF